MNNVSSDPRFLINLKIGMRVIIQKEDNSEFAPCYIKEILSKNSKHEYGIKVKCEDGKIGRVKHVGTESSDDNFSSNDLLKKLEDKLRQIIDNEFCKIDRNWSENRTIIGEKLKNRVIGKLQTGKNERSRLGIPQYKFIEYTNFSDLRDLILGKHWKYFERIFKDKTSIDVKLNELSQIRNPVAHSNTLPEILEKKIQVYYDDIIRLIEDYERVQK